MSDDVSDIREYYNNDIDYERTRLDHHQLERDLTRRYLLEYLPAQGRVLEIGAATGAYTLWLAEHGYQVLAVDMAPGMIADCQKRLAEAGLQGRVECRLADARDLTVVPESNFDAVLLMGPLYHLVLGEDRLEALRQTYTRLKPGGIFFSAHISRLGILGDLIRNVPQWIEDQAEVRAIIERGRDPENYHKGSFRGYFTLAPEVIELHDAVGLETIALVGVEPAISADDESYNRLEGQQRQLWLDLLYEVSSESLLVASSRHLLYIGRKPEAE